MPKKVLAYGAALAAAFFYSVNQIFNKRVVLAIGTLPSLVLVYLFLTLFDFFFCFLFGDFSIPSQRALFEIVLLSVDGAAAIGALFESFKYLPVGVAITLANLSPIFLTLLVFIFFGKTPSAVKLLAITLTVFSVYLITYSGERKKVSLKRYLLPLITALGWALFGWESYRLLNFYHLSPFALAFYTSLYMFFIFLAALLAVYRGKKYLLEAVFRFKKALWWAILGGFFTSLGFVLSLVPFRLVEPQEAPVVEALFTFTTPSSALFSYLFLGERLSFKQTLGILLAFVSLLLFFLG